ncbi:MAG TPA: hypothetical protein PLI71_09870 [Clostridia bacterium]|nr:hypothetical protein [Clostridia bacterium]
MQLFSMLDNPIVKEVIKQVLHAEKMGTEYNLPGKDKQIFVEKALSEFVEAIGYNIPADTIRDVIKGIVAILNIIGEFTHAKK